jgi:hypothetical protein
VENVLGCVPARAAARHGATPWPTIKARGALLGIINVMPYSLDDRLVIGVASSALFDLSESGAVFDEKGETAYRAHQEEHLTDPLAPGVASNSLNGCSS